MNLQIAKETIVTSTFVGKTAEDKIRFSSPFFLLLDRSYGVNSLDVSDLD